MMRRTCLAAGKRMVLIGLGLLLPQCGPSSATLRNLSSGDLPCGQADIGVYGRTTNNDIDEWTATCKGQLFTCTRPSEGGNATCLPEGGSSSNVAASTKASPSAPPPRVAAPDSVAGFSFGASLEDTQQVCETAGYAWSASGKDWSCSSAPTTVGFDVTVGLRVCAGQVCGIYLTHRPEKNWAGFIADTKERLVAKYGAPTTSDDIIPRPCRPPEEFVPCIDRGELKLRFDWAWPTGEHVTLAVGRSLGQASAVRLDYTSTTKSAL